MNLVTVFSAFNPAEAEVIRSRLEASDFHPVIQHDNPSTTFGYGTKVGGVLVQVPEDEAADAKEFLKSPSEPAE